MREPQAAKRPRPNGRIGRGLFLIGTGRAEGFAQFGATREAYLASLAPWLALGLVTAAAYSATEGPLNALRFFLTSICGLLAPAVIADAFCSAFGRQDRWAHYANVLNCVPWLMLAVVFGLLPLFILVPAMGFSLQTAGLMTYVVLNIYSLWFNWFAARHVLGLSSGWAVLVMLGVVGGTEILVRVPGLFGK